ncbi:MAG: hypothetical protein JKY37_06810, partial [Nannocystaceae bacterium]|nr:hypothetical protein [Nannocystaceae bacterium]
LAVLPPAEARAARATRGESDIDHCPLNYGSEQPPAASVLNLDAVNQPLSVMAQMWGETDRVPLVDLALGGEACRR